jgi:hypothetical protein
MGSVRGRAALQLQQSIDTRGKTDLGGAASSLGIPGEEVVGFEKLVSWFPDFSC